MQNEHYPVVPRNGLPDEGPESMSMSEFLQAPFDELWEPDVSRLGLDWTAETRPLTFHAGEGAASRYSFRPHVDFGAIHALQGTSRPAAYGFGMFDLMTPNTTGRVTRGVHPRVLRHMKTRKIGSKDNANECHICMEAFQIGKRATELPCKHLFCGPCIREWLKNNDTCPVCRYKFPERQTFLTSNQE